MATLGSPTGGALTAANAAEDDKWPVVDTDVGASDSANKYMTTAEKRTLLLTRGALVTLSGNITSPTLPYIVVWDSETGGYDTDSIHDNTTNNTRLTVPSGWTKVRLGVQIAAINISAGSSFTANVRKNGTGTTFAAGIGLPIISDHTPNLSDNYYMCTGPIIDAAATDYFDVRVNSSDTTLTLLAAACSFWMELIA